MGVANCFRVVSEPQKRGFRPRAVHLSLAHYHCQGDPQFLNPRADVGHHARAEVAHGGGQSCAVVSRLPPVNRIPTPGLPQRGRPALGARIAVHKSCDSVARTVDTITDLRYQWNQCPGREVSIRLLLVSPASRHVKVNEGRVEQKRYSFKMYFGTGINLFWTDRWIARP